ncbi:autoinducer binding domain-containing protein [Burkholderia thailandensis]|uniref:autoinducer binding domain-containing protein n=1 Tax=Burkholderia thailandensis TaxID=57975 RepID=UPI0020A50E79|nr:autoinducer binding domain-containing protein [Burkholderia thailandensis]
MNHQVCGAGMSAGREQFVRRMRASRSAGDAFDVVLQRGTELGFQFCAYRLTAPIPITRRRTFVWSNYPNACAASPVLDADRSGRGADTDAQACGVTADATQVFESMADGLWAETSDQGVRYGWALSVRDRWGAVGTLKFARGTREIVQEELDDIEPEMIWLAHLAHDTIGSLMRDETIPGEIARVSLVERQILLWTAEGKTVSEISSILQMSVRNINFHIQNGVGKLGATNKTHAAVKATLVGLIPV